MDRVFTGPQLPRIELRDLIALLMPRPLTAAGEDLMVEMRVRYELADRIIREVR